VAAVIGFEQRGRNGQRTGDIVETAGRIVSGQQRGHVDLEIEQIADRVGVFGPVEAMQYDRTGFG
jgi:hypothetical protein